MFFGSGNVQTKEGRQEDVSSLFQEATEHKEWYNCVTKLLCQVLDIKSQVSAGRYKLQSSV